MQNCKIYTKIGHSQHKLSLSKIKPIHYCEICKFYHNKSYCPFTCQTCHSKGIKKLSEFCDCRNYHYIKHPIIPKNKCDQCYKTKNQKFLIRDHVYGTSYLCLECLIFLENKLGKTIVFKNW